jgi:protein phosphatase
MGNAVKVSFSAVTHAGTSYTVNNDRIYANGRFIHPSAADYAQVSLEMVDTRFFFALSGNMEDDESGVSLISDLKKFHQKALASSKGINVKLDDLVQCVEQASNLIHSLSLGDNDFGDKRPSFSGILIEEGNIAAVSLGSYRIYKLEGETFKLFVNDYKRAERLLKMGIISDEQAEILTKQQKAAMEEGSTTVKKSDIHPLRPGTTYLICSTGLSDFVDEDTIYDILASEAEPDQAAGELVTEALKKEPDEAISALVIRIEEAGEQYGYDDDDDRPGQSRTPSVRVQPRYGNVAARKRQMPVDVGKIAAVLVLVVLAAAVILGGYRLWKLFSPQARDTVVDQDQTAGGSDTDRDDLSDADEIPGGSDTTPADATNGNDDTGADDNDDDGDEGQTGTGSGTGSNTIGPEGTKYTVKAGDMLMVIAKKFYGDESKYKLIMEANEIEDPNKIFVGQELIIPPAD